MTTPRKVYISGPISGLDITEVESSFAQAERLLRSLGHEPVSPLNNGLPYDAPWEAHMVKDLETLSGCDMMFVIDSEKTDGSAGCAMELQAARRMGMEVVFSRSFANN